VKGCRLTLAAAVVLLLPATAHAHLANSGLGPFYDGLLHFSMTPGEILPALALGLFAGRRGPGAGRAAVLALAFCWLVGRLVGPSLIAAVAPPAAIAAVTLGFGALLAADRPMPRIGVMGLAGGLGWAQGALFGADAAISGAGALAVLGASTASVVVVLLSAGQAASVQQPWARVALRVTGSWIAAAGLLMLGWALRGA
jgi:hydrogenase/urease accessory protein HupE